MTWRIVAVPKLPVLKPEREGLGSVFRMKMSPKTGRGHLEEVDTLDRNSCTLPLQPATAEGEEAEIVGRDYEVTIWNLNGRHDVEPCRNRHLVAGLAVDYF